MVERKKKILVFIDWFWPGYKAGGPIRSCTNLIGYLKDEYDFSVITRDTDYCETNPFPGIQSDKWNILPNGLRVYYISSAKLYRRTIKQLILSEDFDAVYLNGIYSLYFTLIPLYYLKRVFSLRLAFKSSSKKIVVAARGMLSPGAISVKKSKKKLFLKSSRIIGLFSNVTFHATSPEEIKDIKTHFGSGTKIQLAPNLPSIDRIAKNKKIKKEKGRVQLVHIARIAPEKGLLYAIEILRNVKAKVDMDIYGSIYDEKYWEKCRSIMGKLGDNVHVNYMGSFPSEKVNEILNNYHFLFLPTHGENFGHVIIESMHSGCPVIISDKTPWRELEKHHSGWDIPLTDTATFATVIEHCSQMNNEEYQALSEETRNFAEGYIRNTKTIELNKSLFRD